MSTTEPTRDKNLVKALADYCLRKGQLRNHVLIVASIHTALRISNLLRLRWDDVYDFENHRVRKSVTIIEKKPRNPKSSRSMTV